MMMTRMLFGMLVSLLMFFGILWIRQRVEQAGQVDRRSKKWLAYYYSAMIPLSVDDFSGLSLTASVAVAYVAAELLGHWLLGMLAAVIILGVILQLVWIRSMEQNHKIDLELPHFIGLIRSSFLATNGNERFALEYAVEHVTLPALKKPFSILSERWKSGYDLERETEITKKFFRNQTVGHLLDALVQEHYGGGSFLRDLDRLTEQARDRYRLAEMRKVATAGSVYALYGVLLLNLLILLLIGIADPQGISVFRETTIGKWITSLSLIGYSSILFVAFRLIRLGDE